MSTNREDHAAELSGSAKASMTLNADMVVPPELTGIRYALAHLFRSGKYADVVFRFRDRDVRAHSIVLGARSSVFADWLLAPTDTKVALENGASSDPSNGERVWAMVGEPSPLFVALLQFIYSDTLAPEISTVEQMWALLALASYYRVLSLVQTCEDSLMRLSAGPDPKTALRDWKQARRLGVSRLEAHLLSFIRSHARVCFSYPEELDEKEFICLLRDPHLELASETTLVAAVATWGRAELDRRHVPFSPESLRAATRPLMPWLRLETLGCAEWIQCVSPSQLLEHEECLEGANVAAISHHSVALAFSCTRTGAEKAAWKEGEGKEAEKEPPHRPTHGHRPVPARSVPYRNGEDHGVVAALSCLLSFNRSWLVLQFVDRFLSPTHYRVRLPASLPPGELLLFGCATEKTGAPSWRLLSQHRVVLSDSLMRRTCVCTVPSLDHTDRRCYFAQFRLVFRPMQSSSFGVPPLVQAEESKLEAKPVELDANDSESLVARAQRDEMIFDNLLPSSLMRRSEFETWGWVGYKNDWPVTESQHPFHWPAPRTEAMVWDPPIVARDFLST